MIIKIYRWMKCLLGFHEWISEGWFRGGTTWRECRYCGRQEIREPYPPDGHLGRWKKNYI